MSTPDTQPLEYATSSELSYIANLSKEAIIVFVLSLVLWYTFLYLVLFRINPNNTQKNGLRRKLSGISLLFTEPIYPLPSGIPKGLNIITSISFKSTVPTIDELIAIFGSKLIPKFHQLSSFPKGGVWTTKQNFNVADHFFLKTIDTNAQYTEFLESMLHKNYPVGTPLWNIHLVTVTETNITTLVMEVDHVIADGLSMMKIAMQFCTNLDGSSLKFPSSKKTSSPKKTVLTSIYTGLQFLYYFGLAVVMPFLPHDSLHTFREKTYTFRPTKNKVTFLPPLSLNTVKLIKSKQGVTVNDVLASALAGASQRYLIHTNSPNLSEKTQVRAMMPYSFPQSDMNLHNEWTLLSLELPVGLKFDSPVKRVEEVKKRMDLIKKRPEPHANIALTKLAGKYLPKSLRRQSTMDLMDSHSIVFSNVPGFGSEVMVGGHVIEGILPFCANVKPQVNMVSYAGKIFVSLVSDIEVMLEPKMFAEFIVEELRELAKSSSVLDDVLIN